MKLTLSILTVGFALRASCREPPAPDNEPTASSQEPGGETASTPPDSEGANASNTPSADGGTVHRAHAPSEIEARHILVMYRGSQGNSGQTRTRTEARARAEEALRRARAGEDFADLVREYSDEPGAAARGGALGRFGHGMMVPEFERAAFALDVNAISDVVETQFGFHVIQRTE